MLTVHLPLHSLTIQQLRSFSESTLLDSIHILPPAPFLNPCLPLAIAVMIVIMAIAPFHLNL